MILRKKKGFTLIEAIIAIGVVGFVLLALVGLTVQHIQLTEIAQAKTIALNHATAIIEEMRDRSYTSMSSITSQDWENWANNNGCDTLDQEMVIVQYGAAPDPLQITVNVSWAIRGRTYSVQLSTVMTRR